MEKDKKMKTINYANKLKELWFYFSSFEGSLFRYSLAFSFMMASIPMLMVVVMLFYNSVLDIKLLFDFIYRFVPEEMLIDFVDFVQKKDFPNLASLIISLLVAFNLASRSIYSFMLISANNEGYNIPKFVIKIKAYVLFIVLIFSVGLYAVLASLFQYSIIITFGLGLFLTFFIFYRILTFEKKPYTYGILGAGFATISIMITSRLFFIAVNYFSSYNSVYGPMASIIMVMLAIYFIASLIYFGYCLNAVFGASYPVSVYKHEALYKKVQEILKEVKKKVIGLIKWK